MKKWPQHVTPDLDTHRAKAPYNFVPLPERIFLPEKEQERFEEHDTLLRERLHGWIDLEILTETPTYTRCAYPREEEHREVNASPPKQDFYHHGDPNMPVIPGSSLRGMVRSLVEILSYARISRLGPGGRPMRLLDKALVHRFVAQPDTPAGKAYQRRFLGEIGLKAFDYPGPNVRAGYLEQKGHDFAIRPARTHEGVGFIRVPIDSVRQAGIRADDLQVVDPVFVRPAEPALHERSPVALHYARTETISARLQPELEKGVLVCSGRAAGTRKTMHTVIYAPDAAAKAIDVPQDLWEAFEEDRELTRGLPCRKVKPGDPCFYLVDEKGKLKFLGPVLFFRIPYDQKTGDFVPDALMGGVGLDLAEALFGTVNPRSNARDEGSHRGRVSFDDARMSRAPAGGPFLGGPDDGRRKPAILSSPKPTSFQNYLVQRTNARDGRELKRGLSTYWSRTPEETVLRGHKKYWHRGEPGANELSTDLPVSTDTQHTVMRPVGKGVAFTSKLRFENLTPLELGALLHALDLPGGCRHHLGGGKPHGMGTVRIRTRLHLVDPQKRYASLVATGEEDAKETDAKAKMAREGFRTEIVKHHNDSVRSPHVEPRADLWEIPRLAALQALLSWDHRPGREKTRYMDLQEFKARPVLPTPAATLGRPDPNVDAEVPESKQGSVEKAVRTAAPGPPRAVRRTIQGRIAYFSQGNVGVLLDGEARPRKLPLSLEVFPPAAWKKLNGNELRKGRPVAIELDGDRVLRVVPIAG